MPVSVAFVIVKVRDSGVKLVCKDPNKLVTKLVFCHKVIVEEVIALVMRCKFGNQAANAIIDSATNVVTKRYFGCRIILTNVVIVTEAEDQ